MSDRSSTAPTSVAPADLSAEAVRALAARSVRRESASSFQALLAAATAAARRVVGPVCEAEAAALNLAQRRHVAAVSADLDAIVAALGAGISTEGRCLTPARRRPADAIRAVLRPTPGWLPRLRDRAALLTAEEPPTRTWVSAAAAAVEVLGQSAEHVATLAAAQPSSSSARDLGERVAARLREHRDALLADVARVVD